MAAIKVTVLNLAGHCFQAFSLITIFFISEVFKQAETVSKVFFKVKNNYLKLIVNIQFLRRGNRR